jgi:CPA2 family monovalent cation:H+ antiporter-2
VPHQFDVIVTLTAGLGAALLCGLAAQQMRIAPVVGYLVAGILIGPFTPGLVAQRAVADQFAEIGVILLMFGVGLHFHLRDLVSVARVAVTGALVQIGCATAAGVLLASCAGWSASAGVVFGLSLSVASTVVLLRLLAQHDALATPAGRVAVGWLVAEDLFTVLVLVVLPLLGGRGPLDLAALTTAIALALAKIALLVAFTLVVGRRLIPALLAAIARTRSRELFTLGVLVAALGIAVGAAKAFGASLALGAFLAGLVVGQSRFGARAAADALPMRDAFAVLFFVATGMMLDPRALLDSPGLIAGTLAIVLIIKPLTAIAVVAFLRGPPRTAATVAVGLSQIGEFSFILAALAIHHQILPPKAIQPLVATAMISIAMNPLLYRLIGPVSRWLGRRRRNSLLPHATIAPVDRRVIVVGDGPIGRIVVRILQDQGFVPTVIELDPGAADRLRVRGVDVVHGDAGTEPVLEAAGVKEAQGLIFTSSGSAVDATRVAKELNPAIQVVARAAFLREVSTLIREGADAVITGEAEVALAMTERLLRDGGANDAEVEATRARVRAEIATAARAPLG